MLLFYTDHDFSSQLNFCALIKSDYLFYHSCFTIIKDRYLFKFSVLNAVNVFFCQNYSHALQDLILIEKCLITRSHSVASILKLCLNDVYNSVTYNQLHEHVIILFQNSDSLLDILSFNEIRFHKKIKIIWFDNRTLTANNLKSYLKI